MEPQEIHRWKLLKSDTKWCVCECAHLFALREETIAFIRASKCSQTDNRLRNILKLLRLPKCLAHFVYLWYNFMCDSQN